MDQNITEYSRALESLDLTNYLKEKMKVMLSEVKILLKHLNNKDYENTKNYKNSKHLFRGATGVRHVDFIGYKDL